MGYILIVDDAELVRESIQQTLARANYAVKTAANGEVALTMIQAEPPDLILLDIIMPGIDGIEVCRRIRSIPYLAKIPIMFLTVKDSPQDIVAGLDAGADNYLTKPIDMLELQARVRAVLRRLPGGTLDPEANTLKVGNVELAIHTQTVKIEGKIVDLSTTEHRLLYTLMTNAGYPVSVDTLLETIWEYPSGVGDPNLVRVHIFKLRAKLGTSDKQSPLIQNVRGKGYLFVPQ